MNRKLFHLFTIVLLATGACGGLSAQKKNSGPVVGCIDPNLRLQADAIKQHYVSQGFKVYRDAMVNMSSQETFPIVVQLTGGQLYQIIYVGQQAAANHKMVIYDGADNKLVERPPNRNGEEWTNYIIYEFVPERSDVYLLTFMTKLKNKDFCGSVCILEADRSKGKIEYKPYVP